MATKEIKSDDWNAFFQLFSQMERDTLVSIDHVSQTGVSKTIVQDVSLQAVEYDQTDPCSNVVRIRTGREGLLLHQIVEPIHVKIRQDTNNRKILQIDAETGITQIKFHSGRLDEVLHALEKQTPAE